MTHVLRYDAMSEHLVQWKRKREPCSIQNVTNSGLIPQRGLNESPQVLLSHVRCQVFSHSKYLQKTIGDKIVETLSSNGVLWKTKQYATLPLPSKQGWGSLNRGTTLHGWVGKGKLMFFLVLSRQNFRKALKGRVFRLMVSTIADMGNS